jgi:FMN-dependent oxidoreductase (nitrilotriacetate monooxygenase family)
MIVKPPKHMILTAFIAAAGYHRGAWRLPGSRAEELGRFSLVKDLVQMAEAAKFDSVFFGDINSGDIYREQKLHSSGLNEPVSLLSALSAVTSKIGLSGTISTTFSYPYQTARQLNGIDSLSNGRAGWNIVTSFMGAENFGLDQLPPREERYRRANEFVEACVQLWDSWSDDAVVVDRANGTWVDPDLVRPIDYEGEYYKVKGPLNMRRSPQGRPVLFQAGQSPSGMKLAAKYADAIYTTQNRMKDSIETVAAYRPLLVAEGRDPDALKILPGLLPILGETKADAEDYAASLSENIDWEVGAKDLSKAVGIDVSDLDLDDTIPAERWDIDDPSFTSRRDLYRKLSVDEGYSVRKLIIDAARTGGHQWMIGTASEVADVMIEWFENKACHGFNLNPPSMPEGLSRICTLLIPELQNRGYFREEYEGDTLRDHLGLSRPGAWDTKVLSPVSVGS